MIDTDKYEGHTPAPWGRDWNSVFEYGGEEIARLTLGNKGNEQLIADAPLLLQEIKRLREEVEQWESLVKAFAKILKSTNLPPELIE